MYNEIFSSHILGVVGMIDDKTTEDRIVSPSKSASNSKVERTADQTEFYQIL
jgi:hypothetical protein